MIPVFPLDGALLLPGGELPLKIFEPRYLNMIDDAMAGDRMIGMIQTRPAATARGPNLAGVGCAGRITSYAETSRRPLPDHPDRRLPLRGRRGAGRRARPTARCAPHYEPFADDLADDERRRGLRGRASRFATALKRYLEPPRARHRLGDRQRRAPLEALVNSLSMGLPFEPAEKQALLEAPDLADRCEALTALLEIDAIDDGG